MNDENSQITEYPPSPPHIAVDFSDNTTFIDRIRNTIEKISFNDPPIIVLMVFHLIILVLTIKFRKNMLMSSLLFGFASFCLAFSQKINQLLIQNYSFLKFSVNYFDQDCRMTFYLWSIPFLIECCIILFLSIIDLFCKIANLSCFRNFKRNHFQGQLAKIPNHEKE